MMVNVADVFHHPARVARREFEIGDDGVQRELGVELAIGVAGEFLVSIVSERLGVFHHEPRDSGLSGIANARIATSASVALESGTCMRHLFVFESWADSSG